MATIKRCTKCFVEKQLTEFSKDRTHSDGYRSQCKQCRKQYNQFHKEEIKVYKREYRQNHKIQTNEYCRNRRLNDEQCRLVCNLRSCVNQFLKGKSNSPQSFELLGCSPEFYHYWMTSQLQDNQKLEEMESDHIAPCSSFDLTDEQQRLQCFNWRNCQPLTREQNSRKGNRRDEELERKHRTKANSFKYEIYNTPVCNIVVTVTEWL